MLKGGVSLKVGCPGSGSEFSAGTSIRSSKSSEPGVQSPVVVIEGVIIIKRKYDSANTTHAGRGTNGVFIQRRRLPRGRKKRLREA